MEQQTQNVSVDLINRAQEFLQEASGTAAERTKKSIPSAHGLQMFLLYVRAGAQVPRHQVKGPITVQTLLGHARMTAEERCYDLPQGSIASFGAGIPHDVFGVTTSVLLVTHAQMQDGVS
jgi:quercetin dioxygenase-like cupin family protein